MSLSSNYTSFVLTLISQLDNELISDLNIQAYRKQIALVSQEPVSHHISRVVSIGLTLPQTLYAGTVRFNILLGAIKPHSEVTQQEIEEACRSANILEFIDSLPKFVSASQVLSGSTNI